MRKEMTQKELRRVAMANNSIGILSLLPHLNVIFASSVTFPSDLFSLFR